MSPAPNRPWGSYFSLISVLLLVLSILAFSDNLFTDVGQASNSDPKFIIHGLFGLAWYVLLTTQANLVRAGNLRLHQKLGIATFLVGIGVTLTTLYLFIVLWKGWAHMQPEVRANRLLLPGYALCLLLAWQWRGQPDWHKRLILVGTFFMLGPVLDRTFEPLIVWWLEPLFGARYTAELDEAVFLTFRWVSWIGFFLSLALHDWKTRGAVHRMTWAGSAWFALAILLSEVT